MRTFSRPLTEKRRLPRKPTYQASNQAASQGRCVNGLTPTGDGNLWPGTELIFAPLGVNGLTPTGDGNYIMKRFYFVMAIIVLMALPQQGTETSKDVSLHYFFFVTVLMALPQQGTETPY